MYSLSPTLALRPRLNNHSKKYTSPENSRFSSVMCVYTPKQKHFIFRILLFSITSKVNRSYYDAVNTFYPNEGAYPLVSM